MDWKKIEEMAATEGLRVVSSSKPDTFVLVPASTFHLSVNKMVELLRLNAEQLETQRINSLVLDNFWGPSYDPALADKLEQHLDSQGSDVIDVWAAKPMSLDMAKWRNKPTESQSKFYLNFISEIGVEKGLEILGGQAEVLGEPGHLPQREMPTGEV